MFKIKDVAIGETFYGATELTDIIPDNIPSILNKKWLDISTRWFNEGIGKDSKLVAVYGLDKASAIKHINCIMNTWQLTKKEKIRTCAYLLSQWFLFVIL